MPDKDESARITREAEARARLRTRGADAIPHKPWQPASMPSSAIDNVDFALTHAGGLDAEDLRGTLALMRAARDEIDGMESGLLFLARSAGLTWAQIAEAMGYRSPQAAQQYFTRLTSRASGENA